MVKTSVNHTQEGTPYGVRVHVEDRHSGGTFLYLIFFITPSQAADVGSN